MASLYTEGQNFGWNDFTDHRYYSKDDIYKAPRPRIALLSSRDSWYSFNRSGLDAVVFWTTESLT